MTVNERYRRQWRELIMSMSAESYLASVNYGVKLEPRHEDLRQQAIGKHAVLEKLLKESRALSRQYRPKKSKKRSRR